jgi:hypothetical protein
LPDLSHSEPLISNGALFSYLFRLAMHEAAVQQRLTAAGIHAATPPDLAQ